MTSNMQEMAAQKWKLLLVASVLVQVCGVSASREVLHNLSKGFTTALEQCKKELSLGDNVIQDFLNYWREDYELVNRDTGCAIICMAMKHDLLTADGIHHENAHGFVKSHGADDDLAKQLVTMIHDCERDTVTDASDDCLKTLEVAKCFRTKIHELKWAPDMETILKEIMTDI